MLAYPVREHIKVIRYNCSSCRYNERQLIHVTVVRRVRPRAERWCDCKGHRRWKRAGRTLFRNWFGRASAAEWDFTLLCVCVFSKTMYVDRHRYTVFWPYTVCRPNTKTKISRTHTHGQIFFWDVTIRNSLRSNNYVIIVGFWSLLPNNKRNAHEQLHFFSRYSPKNERKPFS